MFVQEKVLDLLFPQYGALFNQENPLSDERLQHFISNELPGLISTIQNLESVFMKVQSSHSNLILKSPPTDNLFQSFIRKVAQKAEKYMNGMDQLVSREENEHFEFSSLRKQIRDRFGQLQQQLAEKYIKNKSLNRTTEEYIAQCIYRILQYYNFTKSDTHNISSKFTLKSAPMLGEIKSSVEASSINSIITLDSEFKNNLQEFVDKRMRPFLQKKQFLNGKIRDIMKEQEAKYQVENKNIIKNILIKEKNRCQREIYNSLQKQLKGKSVSKSYVQEPIELNNQMNTLKSEFQKIKSSPYYLQIIRGTFKLTFGNETRSLQNLFGMCKLQQYLLSASKLTDRMISFLQRLVDFKKNVNSDIGILLEDSINNCISQLSNKEETSLSTLVLDEFDRLKELLSTSQMGEKETIQRFQQDRSEREEQRTRKIQEEREKRVKDAEKRKVQIQQKAEKERQIREEKKKIQEQRKQRQSQQMKQKERQRKKQEAQRLEKFNKQKQRLEQQKLVREEIRRQSEAERKQRLEEEKQTRQRQRLQKTKKIEEEKNKVMEQDKRKKQIQEQNKRRIDNQRKIAQEKADQKKRNQLLQKQQEAKKKKQQEVRKQKQRQQQAQRLASEKRKAEELKLKKQKQKAEEEERKKQQKRLLEQKKKQEQKLALQQKKKDDQLKKKKEKQEKQEKQRKQLQQKVRKEQQAQAERQKKEQQKALQKQRLQLEKKQKLRVQNEKKQAERVENQKKDRQRIQSQKRQKQRRQAQALEQKKRKQEQTRIQEEQRKQKELQQKKKRQDEEREKQRIKKQQQDQRIKIEKTKQEQNQKRSKEEKEKQQLKKLQSNKTKGKAKKQSQLDYQNIYEEDFQPYQDIQNPKKPSVKKSKDNDFGFLDQDDVEFPDDGADDQGQNGNQLQTKELTTLLNLNLFNDSLKSSQYIRKNKPNLEMFNKMEQFAALFEQFTANHQMFVFNDVLSAELYQTSKLIYQSEEEFTKLANQIFLKLKENYAESTQSAEYDITTKYFFIFNQDNMMGLKILQFEIGGEGQEIHPRFTFILTENINQQGSQLISGLVETILFVFGIQIEEDDNPDNRVVIIPEQSQAILKTMDNYLPNLLLLFNWMYQYRNPQKPITIDQYTVERFFYCCHAMVSLYPAIQEHQDQIEQFYGELYKKYNKDKDIQTENFQYPAINAQIMKQLVDDFRKLAVKFSKGKAPSKYTLSKFTLPRMDEQQNVMGSISLYVEMGRQQKLSLRFYILTPDSETNDFLSSLFEEMVGNCQKQIQEFDVEVYIDFTRHNGLYEFSNWSLPVWAQIATKRKMTANQAMAVMNFSLLPYFTVYKSQD